MSQLHPAQVALALHAGYLGVVPLTKL